MRRIMADTVMLPSMLYTKPTGEQMVLDISEPDTGNQSKRSGVQGFSEQVFHDAQRTLTIEKSGGIRDDDEAFDGRFKVLFASLKDMDGDEVMDSYTLAMGAEKSDVPRMIWGVSGEPDERICWSPKIIKLEKHNKEESSALATGILGLLAWWSEDVTTSNLYTLQINKLYASELGSGYGSCSYSESLNRTTSGMVEDFHPDAGFYPGLDGVELDDGTVLFVVTDHDTAYTYRLYNLVTLEAQLIGSFPLNALRVPDSFHVGVEKIGTRIVVAIHYASGGVGAGAQYLWTRYSDDNGLTWSDEVVLEGGAGGTTTDSPFIDLVKGQDGRLYLSFVEGTSDDLEFYVTSDGVNWSPSNGLPTSITNYRGGTFTQDAHGQWHLFTPSMTDHALNQMYRWTMSSHDDADVPMADEWRDRADFCRYFTDGSDNRVLEMCARSLNDDGFIDVAYLFEDSNGGTYQYSVWVVRVNMWASIIRGAAEPWTSSHRWGVCWAAHMYPSTSDAHPNGSIWTRTLTGASTAALYDSVAGGALRLDAASSEDIFYARALLNDTYDIGHALRFEMRVVSGECKVFGNATANANDKDIGFHIAFDAAAANIKLYNRLGAVVDTFTPANWAVTDFNEYELHIFRATLILYRCPSDNYREVCPAEVIFQEGGLSETTYTGQDNWIAWGCNESAYAPSGGTARVDFRSVYSTNDSDNYLQPMRGRRMALEPVGLLGGESFKFNGEFHFEDDAWTLDTGAVNDARNVNVPSPSIAWVEPAQTVEVASPARVFEWRRPIDEFDEDVEFRFNAFAMFGRNFQDFKIERYSNAGALLSTVFDTSGGDYAYFASLEVDLLRDNSIGIATSPMKDNMFACDGLRNWFVRMTDGAATGKVFKIISNSLNQITSGVSFEGAGVLAGDAFTIYGSSFFHELANKSFSERIRLTVTAQYRPYGDDGLKLGTFIAGEVYSLPTDEWGFQIRHVANLQTVGGPSGIEQVRERGPVRRIIELSYSGEQDLNMGVTPPAEMFRKLGGGVNPAVWIDDGSVLDNDGERGMHWPMLVRPKGPISQRHAAYNRVSDGVTAFNQGDVTRNIFDTSGFKLEEIL